jgi:hypothetical protein
LPWANPASGEEEAGGEGKTKIRDDSTGWRLEFELHGKTCGATALAITGVAMHGEGKRSS